MSADRQTLLKILADALAAACGTLAGGQAELSTVAFAAPRCWVATLTRPGGGTGSCTMAIDHAGAAALSRRVANTADEVEDASVGDLLRGAIERAAAALTTDPAGGGLELTLATLEPREGAVPAVGGADYAITVEGLDTPIAVRVGWIEPAAADAPPGSLAPTEERLGDRIDAILDIELPVIVRFGRTEMPIRALSTIGPGSVIDLGRSPDDPVEVLVSNRVVARGEVVIVGGNYGVRVLDVTSQSERARSLES